MTPERFAKLQRALDRRQPDLTVFMDSVNKPANFAAIIRTADAVGVQRVHAVAAGDELRRHHVSAGGHQALGGGYAASLDTRRARGATRRGLAARSGAWGRQDARLSPSGLHGEGGDHGGGRSSSA